MTFVGTEDFQGPAQWQSLALLQEARTIANAATFQWPAGGGTFPVANWQSLQVGPTGSNAGVIDWIYQWYADSAGTILLGARLLSTTNVGADCFTLGNLGPFLTITALNNSGGSRSVAMYATLTNRIQAPFDPLSSLPMVVRTLAVIAAGGNVTVDATYLYAGSATLSVLSNSGEAWQARVFCLNSAGALNIVGAVGNPVAASPNVCATIILPPRPIRVSFDNLGAAGHNFEFALSPDAFR